MKDLKLGPPFRHAGLVIVPIEAVWSECFVGKAGFYLSWFKEPSAIVVVTASDVRALDVAGQEMNLDQLVEEVPALRELVDSVSGTGS
jgi:hypothetical protein